MIPLILSWLVGAILQDSFEGGLTQPQGWGATETGTAFWSQEAHTGKRSVAVTGDEATTVFWMREDIPWEPGATYRLQFWAKASPEASGGTIIAGPNLVNRDFQVGTEWQRREFIFTMPQRVEGAYLRLGTWHKRGTVWFDDVSLSRVRPLYRQVDSVELGEGEQILGMDGQTQYRFRAPFQSLGSNSARPLWRHTASFNSNRWTMGSDAEVIYHHQVGDAPQTQAQVEVHVGYHRAGTCIIEASADAQRWLPVGRVESLGKRSFDLPASLLPAKVVFVRLRAEGPQANFQIDGYTYQATLDMQLPDAEGQTIYLEERTRDDSIQVAVESLGELRPGEEGVVRIRARGLPEPQPIQIALDGRSIGSATVRDGLNAVPYRFLEAGAFQLTIQIGPSEAPLYRASASIRIPILYAADYGYLLDASAGLWWAEGTYKISRERPLPQTRSDAVRLEAARNEYEPVQIVLRPPQGLSQVRVTPLPFRQGKATIDASNLSVCLVDYVPVRVPTDEVGSVGHWPDPLPPYEAPFDVPAGRNQPLWVTVYVPKDAPAGDYEGGLRLQSGDWQTTVPMKLHVWDFTLPDETPVESGFGLSAGAIKQYHQLETDEELRTVLDRYLQNFAAHRIAPYDPMMLDPIRVQFDTEALTARLDFTAFDRAAARYLDDFKFTRFRLGLRGMGGGTFHARRPGKIGPYEQGTPEYETLFRSYLTQLEQHLAEKGWLAKAYVYWFDEPEPKDYPFVIDGMERIHRYAPGLTRLLTEQPEPELYGYVDLWCPVTPRYDPQRAHERQAAGEKVWWYVCTAPKAPYCTLFIDHYAVEMRLWLWQTWKYGVDGILVWQTTYWTSPTAFPPPKRQNPYEDAMGYRTGYGLPVGSISYWGNGDGRFLYPPKRAAYGEKSLDGPVNSIRWELLREGIEDYLYFWLLRQRVQQLEAAGNNSPLLEEARRLLDVPSSIVGGMTEFTKDPQPIYEHRRKLARMLERL